ncbi:MAG: hypothetical protein QNJ68_18485 [Microcoleaceae cyanobacterium MO_207.B10]|nr:hypothetical protein [Microcoleaceae cyanobacterium MO_207.B10]
MKKALIVITCLISVSVLPVNQVFGQSFRNDIVNVKESGNGAPWGTWTRPAYCPPGSWAAGYTMRVEPGQGRGDDTALNAVALYCRDRRGRNVGRISPHQGFWGSWVEGAGCQPAQFFTHFQLKVERGQGRGDDTAANSVRFWCSNDERVEATGGPWGRFGEWQGGFSRAAICGVRAKVESKQGRGDDTALNDLEFTWCRI